MELTLSVEDTLLLGEILKDPRMLEMFNSLVKIFCEQSKVDEKEAKSIIFPYFARGAISACKEKDQELRD
jgi:hypothetical protein